MGSNSPSGQKSSMPSGDGTTVSGRSTSSKIAIPRLRGSSKSRGDGPGGSGGNGEPKHRVSHACEPCRQRKTKCSGERPICKHCQDFKITCFYADGKRDRAKNEIIDMKSRISLYETLLDQLKGQVDSAGQLAITKALRGFRAFELEPPMYDLCCDGESLVSAEVGSTGSTDHIREDINADSAPYPTGYMGKSSEVTWIQRVAQQLAKEADRDSPPLGEGIYTTTSTPESRRLSSPVRQQDMSSVVNDEYQFQTPAYHLDDLSVSITDSHIDPYLLPDKRVADELTSMFFTTFHPSFPIISKKLFMSQYETFFQTFFPPDSSKKWLAMLNLMLAIASLYAKLVGVEWKESDATEHLKYFGRARILCLDEGCMLEAADLQQVQVVGLAGMYLLASNQTNRAWNVTGLAIRYGQTLGLNLRNEVPGFSEVEKEHRARIWFALYSAENLLCLMTGRPSSIQDRDCSVPLPRPIDEETPGAESYDVALKQCPNGSISHLTSDPLITSPSLTPSQSSTSDGRTPILNAMNISSMTSSHTSPHTSMRPTTLLSQPPPLPPQISSRYFLEHTKLNRITAAVLSSLYSADAMNKSWSDVQGIISALELRLGRWRSDLPAVCDLGKRRDQSNARERLSLAFQYHNARILINRPCLCRLNYRIPNESNRSRDFNRSAAVTCISGARETMALLPDEPNPVGLINISPWWCLLHYLVSAGTILMVEISMRAEHNPQQADGLLKDAKKVIRWLRAMAKNNIAAERSWALLAKLLIVSAPKIGGDTSDVSRDLDDVGGAGTSPRNANMPYNLPSHGSLPAAAHAPPGLHTNVDHMADVQGLFRGFLEDPFPFGNIPIHTPFDDVLDIGNGQLTGPFHMESGSSSLTFGASDSAYGGRQNVVFSGLAPGQQPVPSPEACNSNGAGPVEERLQKRLSLEVSHISSVPLPPQLPQWTDNSEFSMNMRSGTRTYRTSAERGWGDYEAVEANARSRILHAGPDPTRKRPMDD